MSLNFIKYYTDFIRYTRDQYSLVMKLRHRILEFSARIGLLRYLNLTTCIICNGKKINIPLTQGVGNYAWRDSEIWMSSLISRILIDKPGSMVDVGANIGQTLIKFRSISTEYAYFGFEPNPICNNYLNELIISNSFRNTVIFPFGLSIESAIVKLFLNHKTDSAASLIDGFREANEYTNVQFVTVFQGDQALKIVDTGEISIITAVCS